MVNPFKHWDKVGLPEQIKRVEQLERVLNDMTPHERKRHFDMSSWGYQNACGTVGCAAGQAAFDPWFRRRGFKLELNGGATDDDEQTMSFSVISPQFVFGARLTTGVFTNGKFTGDAGGGVYVKVMRAIRAYLNELRAELAYENASDAAEAARGRFQELT